MENQQPVSHFFTVPGAITQSNAQKFGPVGPTAYNINSRFSVAADTMAFAICKGVILVHEHTDPAKVNIILKPYTQPLKEVSVKYFIYRGLKRSDFFTENEVNAIGAGSSDFITKIRTDFAAFYENDPVNPNPPFYASYIGYHPGADNQPDTVLIDDFFFKQSIYVESNGEFYEDDEGFGTFELPLVPMGASLGRFSQGECAIDVVLDYGDYRPLGEPGEFKLDLGYASGATPPQITVAGTGSYAEKVAKEEIFRFLDIAAYYGYHAAGDGEVINDVGGTKVTVKGQDIYTTFLAGFATKNNLYLYIQGDRGRSYNFYDNYNIGETANSLKMGMAAETLTARQYGTQGWPVIIESPAVAAFFLQFVTDNNVNTVLYGQAGNIVNAAKNNFSNAPDLLLPPDENGVLSTFTKVLEIANPITTGGPVIATFNILIYQGIKYKYLAGETVDEDNNPVPVYAEPNYFDDVFDLINAEPVMVGEDTESYSVINSKKLKLINEYIDNKQYGIYAVQSLKVKDQIETNNNFQPFLKRVTYLSEVIEMYDVLGVFIGNQSNNSQSSSAGSNISESLYYKLPMPLFYTITKFTDDGIIIKGLQLKTIDETRPNKFIIGITESEDEELKSEIETLNAKNTKLVLVELFPDNNVATSIEGIRFQKYKVGAISEFEDSIIYINPTNEIFVYSLDDKFFHSENYSRYIAEVNNDDNVIIDKEI